MLISLSEKYYTEKAKSFIEMEKFGIPIPESIILSNEDIVKQGILIARAEKWNVERVYLRVCFSDLEYPHYYADTPNLGNLQYSLKNLCKMVENISRFDILCQPMLSNTEWAGGLIKCENRVYVEYVYGMGASLFRKGEIFGRVLINGMLKQERLYQQKCCLHMSDGKIEETKCNKVNLVIPDFSKILENINLSDNVLYEFGILKNGNIIFFDGKKSDSKRYYQKIDCLYKNAVNYKERYLYDHGMRIQYPKLEDLDRIKKENKIYIEKGAILSHMCSYMLQNNYVWECVPQ